MASPGTAPLLPISDDAAAAERTAAAAERAAAAATAPLLPTSDAVSASGVSGGARSSRRLLLALVATASFLLLFALLAAATFLLSSTSNHTIRRPAVLLVSFDGFRFGYHLKAPTPNIRRLIADGTVASEGLIPVFPTLTFPNHYSIVTGLHPESHGIINNRFVDPVTQKWFRKGTEEAEEAHWWGGEPLWDTVVKNGVNAAAYFWPGAEVIKGNWSCPPQFCPKFNLSVPFDHRVDTVLSYFDLPAEEIPSFTALYFEDPDSQGHKAGPDHPNITAAVANMDRVLGRLITGLEKRGIFEKVNLILVGDHGMVGTCDKKLVLLEDLSPWIQIPSSWNHSMSPLLGIWPTDISAAEVVAKMNEGLSSGNVTNGEYLKMFLKEELPERLHYSDNDRIPRVIGLVGEGYTVAQTRTGKSECRGDHGYDNAFSSMRSIFIAHGPRFRKGLEVESFQNVEIYNLVTEILKIKGEPNNGSASFADSVLLPSP